jgi:hypothetical protein
VRGERERQRERERERERERMFTVVDNTSNQHDSNARESCSVSGRIVSYSV